MLVLLTRNIDLSVASVIGLSAYGAASFMHLHPESPALAGVGVAIAIGLACGSLNGVVAGRAQFRHELQFVADNRRRVRARAYRLADDAPDYCARDSRLPRRPQRRPRLSFTNELFERFVGGVCASTATVEALAAAARPAGVWRSLTRRSFE